MSTLESTPAAASLRAGIQRCDITPPVGMYARTWGAADHDQAEGVHLPITATAIALLPREGGESRLLLAVDWPGVWDVSNELLSSALLPLVDGDQSRLLMMGSHTHGAGLYYRDRWELPGGDLIPAYLEQSQDSILAAAQEALVQAETTDATITWAYGRCSLASNRDIKEPGTDRYLTGFNPDVEADDTLLVGRISRDADDSEMGVIVNYGCHPTTLAWENRLFSPDYIGAMRETVEKNVPGATCVFLYAAAGDLAPAYQYVGDTSVPDKHGRQLGYAALSTLESMLAPRQKLVYTGAKESGAPLAVWRPAPFEPSQSLSGIEAQFEIPLKDLPTAEELKQQMGETEDRFLQERMRRKLRIVEMVGSDSVTNIPGWIWKIGDALLMAQPCEPYSCFQSDLREHFAPNPVVICSVTNSGGHGYMYPKHLADQDLYQVWQSPYGANALETLTEGLKSKGGSVIRNA
ncbi:MAG: hypothetical protein QF473_06430 [Planctomycetota bacterium]|nr:hypothetical protein [Planctomycetota bacterium]